MASTIHKMCPSKSGPLGVLLLYRSLVHVIVLIYILQYGTLDGTVFLPVLGLCPFGHYHSLYLSGHALNQVSTNPLGTLSNPTFTYSKAHVRQQEGPHKHQALA